MSDRVLQGCRLLVVEDEYLLAQDMHRKLEAAGATVLGPVPKVADAVKVLAREAHVDGAVLDVNLGTETVFALLRFLGERAIPFLFSTGYDSWAIPEEYADVRRCGKPIDIETIRQMLLPWARQA